MNVNVDLQVVVNKLSEQLRQSTLQCAYLEAVVERSQVELEQARQRIQELTPESTVDRQQESADSLAAQVQQG